MNVITSFRSQLPRSENFPLIATTQITPNQPLVQLVQVTFRYYFEDIGRVSGYKKGYFLALCLLKNVRKIYC